MNIKKIAVNDWVTSQNKVGKIVSEGEKGEFWVLWSGDSLPMNSSAKSLQIVDYEGEDLAGKTFKDGRCNRLFYEGAQGLAPVHGVKAEVYLEHKKKPQIWSLEKLNQELESEKSSSANPSSSEKTFIPLNKIRRDGGTQPRANINHQTVLEYVEDMKKGDSFPPVVVYYDGTYFWLCDGFHRFEAAFGVGLKEIAAIVKQGTRRDAVLYSVGANAKHGLRRTNADKRRAVMRLLEDEEWSEWSNRKIARQVMVDEKTVRKLRESICGNSADTKLNNQRKVERGGKTYIQDTTNIGKAKQTESSPPTEDPASIPESTQLEEDKEITNPSSEENNQPSDTPAENAPLNIREIFSVGDLAKIKEGNHEFSGQSGTITFIPDRHRAVVEFAPGKRKVIQLEDFELPDKNKQTDNEPPNIRKIFSVGDLARIKKQNPDFGGQQGIITFIPNRHSAVVEFPFGKRKLIQLEDFELPQPKQSQENSLAVGDRVKIKDSHYFGGQSGIITSFPNRDSVIVEFSPGKRELINRKDLDLQPLPQPKPTKKKEIIIQEGLNYKAGCPGYGCKWYVEVSEENYKRLQEYREKVGTITLDAAIGRFLEEENDQKPVNSDDICIGLTSNLEQLPDDRIQLVVNAISKFRPKIICRAAKAIGTNSLDMEED